MLSATITTEKEPLKSTLVIPPAKKDSTKKTTEKLNPNIYRKFDPKNIFAPSRSENGIKLKSAIKAFINMTSRKKVGENVWSTAAKKIFARGPPSAIMPVS